MTSHQLTVQFCALVLVLALAMQESRAADSPVLRYAVAIDHLDAGFEVEVFRDERERLYLRRSDLEQAGILELQSLPGRGAAEIRYQRSTAIEGYAVHLDEVSQRLHLLRHRRPHMGAIPGEALLLDVIVNGQRVSEPLFMHVANGEIILSPQALEILNIDQEQARLNLGVDDDLPLHAIAGENFALNFSTLTLRMTVPPILINPVKISLGPRGAPLRNERRTDRNSAIPGEALSGQLSYDLSTGLAADSDPWYGGRFELGIGNGTSSCVSGHAWTPGARTPRRLDTACIMDWPQRMLSLKVGDGISNTGDAGQAVRYAGIRLGTDFDLAPGLVTQPGLALRGSARVPSTLELWVDQMRTLRREVDSGQFDIEDIPVHTGSGEVRLLIDNEFGRQEVSRRAFYSDPSLLAPGLSKWSIELGKLRDDYGLESSQYGEPFGLINTRFGARDWLTVEPRLEVSNGFQGASLGNTFRMGQLGILQVGGAYSLGNDNLHGHALRAGFFRRGRNLSLGLIHEVSSENFMQLGFSSPGAKPERRSQVNLGYNLWNAVSISLGSVLNQEHDGDNSRYHRAAISGSIGDSVNFSMSLFVPAQPDEDPLFSLHFSMPFGSRDSASMSTSRQGDSVGQGLSMQRSLPSGPGYGYNVNASRADGTGRAAVELMAQGNYARVQLGGRYYNDQFAGQAQLRGSVLASRSGLHLSRFREGSTAIIDIGTPGVRVYHDERLAGTTNLAGVAVVPGLRPYQNNRLRLSIDDLPLDTQAMSTELEVMAGRRQVISAVFEVTRSQHLSGNLRLADGEPVPAGAVVILDGGEQRFPVGYEGFLYIPVSAGEIFTFEVSWPGGQCYARLSVESSDEPFLDAGDIACTDAPELDSIDVVPL